MYILLASLGGMLLKAIPGFVAQVLISLGLAAVTYTGVDFAIGQFKGEALSAIASLPPEVSSMLAYMKIGQCINIVFSAYSIESSHSLRRNVYQHFQSKTTTSSISKFASHSIPKSATGAKENLPHGAGQCFYLGAGFASADFAH